MEATASAPAPRKEATGPEQVVLGQAFELLQKLQDLLVTANVHESFAAGVTSSYEKMLDAQMYGYPGAIFDGWGEEQQRKSLSTLLDELRDDYFEMIEAGAQEIGLVPAPSVPDFVEWLKGNDALQAAVGL